MLIVVTSRKTMSWAMAAIAGISQRRVGRAPHTTCLSDRCVLPVEIGEMVGCA